MVRASTPPLPKKAGFIDKISDTSLFAELVKDKHKRKKALKEIMKKTDDEGLNGNDSVENVNNLNNLTNLNNLSNVVVDEDVMIVEEKRNFRIVSKEVDEVEMVKDRNGPELQDITDIPMPEAEKELAEVSKNGVFSLVSDSEKGEVLNKFFFY